MVQCVCIRYERDCAIATFFARNPFVPNVIVDVVEYVLIVPVSESLQICEEKRSG